LVHVATLATPFPLLDIVNEPRPTSAARDPHNQAAIRARYAVDRHEMNCSRFACIRTEGRGLLHWATLHRAGDTLTGIVGWSRRANAATNGTAPA
jgi:hypothetical protein